MAAIVRAFKEDRETLRQLLLTLDGFTTLGGPQPKRTFVICTVAAVEVSDQHTRCRRCIRCRRQSSRSLGAEQSAEMKLRRQEQGGNRTRTRCAAKPSRDQHLRRPRSLPGVQASRRSRCRDLGAQSAIKRCPETARSDRSSRSPPQNRRSLHLRSTPDSPAPSRTPKPANLRRHAVRYAEALAGAGLHPCGPPTSCLVQT